MYCGICIDCQLMFMDDERPEACDRCGSDRLEFTETPDEHEDGSDNE